MKLKTSITSILAAGALSAGASASVFFSVDMGNLQDEGGEALVQEGMLYLVSAGADGEFAFPETGSLLAAGSDDAIVASWDLASEISQSGEYIVGSGAVSYDEAWSEGDPLAILWFPNLTTGNQTPAEGEAFGFYRNQDSGVGDLWELPMDGVMLHSLKFFTDADSPLVEGGEAPSFVAAASFRAGEVTSIEPSIDIAGLNIGEPSPATVTFSWNGSTVPEGGFFRVERRLDGELNWSVLGTVAGDVFSFDDSSIGRGKDYEYRVVAVNGFATEVSVPQTIQTLRSSLANIATRGVLGSGDEALILGFVIEGSGPIDILATAKGPELGNQGITNFALDPTIALYPFGASAPDVENQDWGDSQVSEISDLVDRSFAQSIAEQTSKDAALAFSPEGTQLFTAIVNDNENSNGLGLVEVFDASGTSRNGTAPNDAQNRLVNVATRGFVGTGNDVLIAGFIVDGQVDSKLLLRGLGPSIGIGGNLADPTITLYRTDFTQPGFPQIEVASNDDWDDDPNAVDEIVAVSNEVGAAVLDSGSKDSILLVDAVPGLYSFVLSGVSDGTGIGLVEVFLAD